MNQMNTCYDCGGKGCTYCNDTGLLETPNYIPPMQYTTVEWEYEEEEYAFNVALIRSRIKGTLLYIFYRPLRIEIKIEISRFEEFEITSATDVLRENCIQLPMLVIDKYSAIEAIWDLCHVIDLSRIVVVNEE